MVRWLRIYLPKQRTQVQSLVWKDSTAEGQLSPWAPTTKAYNLEPELYNRHHHNEKPPTPQLKSSPLAETRESLHIEMKTQRSHKLINWFKKTKKTYEFVSLEPSCAVSTRLGWGWGLGKVAWISPQQSVIPRGTSCLDRYAVICSCYHKMALNYWEAGNLKICLKSSSSQHFCDRHELFRKWRLLIKNW